MQPGGLASGIAARAERHARCVPGQPAAGAPDALACGPAPAQLRLAVQVRRLQVHMVWELTMKLRVDDGWRRAANHAAKLLLYSAWRSADPSRDLVVPRGACRQCSARLVAIKEAEAAAAAAPRVEVRLKVHGGLDLRLQTPPAGMQTPARLGVQSLPAQQ